MVPLINRLRARHRPVRPILFMLVFGAFLAIVGTTASGQAALVTADSSTTLLNATVGADAATVPPGRRCRHFEVVLVRLDERDSPRLQR
jgi:hypothetical protein